MDKLLAHAGLVHHIARKWWASFEKAGMGVEYDDLVQEGYMAGLNAVQKFDEGQGWAFSTYFVTCANHHYAALYRRMRKNLAVSLDEPVEEDLSRMDMLEDTASNPELVLEAECTIHHAINELPALAFEMLKLYADPPEFVQAQFEAVQAKREQVRQHGVDERHPPEINLAFISSLFAAAGVRAKDLAVARQQIRDLELAHAV